MRQVAGSRHGPTTGRGGIFFIPAAIARPGGSRTARSPGGAGVERGFGDRRGVAIRQ